MEQEWTETTTQMPVVFSANESTTIAKFAAAFVKAQKEIKGAVKDATNPHFKNQYADLSSVMAACKDSLNKNGIAIIQTPARSEPGRLALTTKLLHESGEWMAGTGEIPIDRAGPQAYGSALTYARRYFLSAMVGVCPEDDDGNDADNRGQRKPEPTPAQRQEQKRQSVTPTPDDEQYLIRVDEAFDAREAAAQVGDPGFKFTREDRRVIRSGVARKCGKESICEMDEESKGKLIRKIVDGDFDHFRAAAKKNPASYQLPKQVAEIQAVEW